LKHIGIDWLIQSFSFCEGPKPNTVWALAVEEEGDVPGVAEQLISKAMELSDHWVGWGFANNSSFMLFESQNDAIYATIAIEELKG
jgi:hypothetical protein